jgi:flagellar motility protein MotE (MotC chaperone)
MTRVRLLPVLVFGLVSFLTLKLLTIAMNLPDRQQVASASGDPFARSITRAREGAPDDQLITGATGKKTESKPAESAAAEPKMTKEEEQKAREELLARIEREGTRVPAPAGEAAAGAGVSPAEKALLEKLRSRRGEIEARDRELDLRDNLLKLSERKLDERIGELRTLEGQLGTAGGKQDAKTRYKPLVVMYESMKPKEAARVFDRLDVKVLMDLVGHMNPRKVSEIMAAMEPAAAEKLTLALARAAAQGDMAENSAPPQPDTELPRLPAAPRR